MEALIETMSQGHNVMYIHLLQKIPSAIYSSQAKGQKSIAEFSYLLRISSSLPVRVVACNLTGGITEEDIIVKYYSHNSFESLTFCDKD